MRAYCRTVLTRYAMPCAVVVVLALLVAVATYKLTPVNFSATCTFGIRPPVTSQNLSTDSLAAQAQQASQQVAQAGRGDVYSAPADAVGVDPATLAANTTVSQVPGSSTFTLAVTDDVGDRAANMANRLCGVYVQRLKTQFAAARDAEVAGLQSQITSLQKSVASLQAAPAQNRSSADQSTLNAQLQAVAADQQLLATAISLPPYDIAVLTQAPGGVRNDTRSFTRNLLVAGVAALLACFLVILVGEVARDQRTVRAR